MATARTRALQLIDPAPDASPFAPTTIDLGAPPSVPTLVDGAMQSENPDGSTTIDFNPVRKGRAEDKAFDANLVDHLDSEELTQIASDLLEGIRLDDESRSEWLQTRARGITLLALKLEEPRGDVGTSSAPLEGMSSVRHPAMLEATIRFQATARAELLPASGPVKVRNDATLPPAKPQAAPPPAPAPLAAPPSPIGGPGIPPQSAAAPGTSSPLMPGAVPAPPPPGAVPAQNSPFPPSPLPGQVPPAPAPIPAVESGDELAQALERDFNHYLTVTATEYVPDTDRMLFYIGFGGDGFKKVYNCPLRRRPVSESVDAEDIIVSNAATDIRNCIRVTHQIKMRPSVLRRMQIVGAYRDVSLPAPNIAIQPNVVEQKKAEIQGTRERPQRPQDGSYHLYECYCELDLDEFAPKQFKGKGLPLPYKVTIERESQEVLEVRRNWDEKDEQALAKQFFVQFPFVRGLGFYGLGFVHLLGNLTMTLTALYREGLDSWMFANFPGGLIAKQAMRQNSNQVRVGPATFMPIDLGTIDDIRKVAMPMPYKEPGASFAAFVTHVEEVVQRIAQTANISVGEGKQDAPVGTTLALIEQATKTMDAVHKRLHAAQAEEFGLLKERFIADPEAFWRHNRTPTMPWTKEQFLKALHDNNIVPVADPNNPTSMHRIAKGAALKELQKGSPGLYDPYKVDQKVMRIIGLDAEDTMNATPAPAPPDPRFEAIQAKSQQQARMADIQEKMAMIKAATAHDQLSDRAADRQSREKLETMRIIKEYIDLQQSGVIHAHEAAGAEETRKSEMMMALIENVLGLHMKGQAHAQQIDLAAHQHDQRAQQSDQQHQQRVAQGDEQHDQRLDQADEMHAAKLEQARALARQKGTSHGAPAS